MQSTPAAFKVKGQKSRLLSDQYQIPHLGVEPILTLNLARPDIEMNNNDPIRFTSLRFKLKRICIESLYVEALIDVKAHFVLNKLQRRRRCSWTGSLLLTELNKFLSETVK